MRIVQGQRICVLCFNITIGSLNCRYHVRFTKYYGVSCHLHQFPNQKTGLPVQLTIHGPSPETGLGTTSGLPTPSVPKSNGTSGSAHHPRPLARNGTGYRFRLAYPSVPSLVEWLGPTAWRQDLTVIPFLLDAFVIAWRVRALVAQICGCAL